MKDKRVGLRLSPANRELLDKKAKNANTTISNFITELIKNGSRGNSTVNIEYIKKLNSLTYEINKIGINLNQIATSFNILIKSNSPYSTELLKLKEFLEKQEALYRQVLEEINNVGKELMK